MCSSTSVLVGSVGTVPPLASLAWSDCSSQRLSLLAVCLRQVLLVVSLRRVGGQSPLHRQFVVVVVAVEAPLNLLQARLLFLVVQSPQSRGLF